MYGQLTVWDILSDEKKPCDYRFQRYIGQKVRFWRDDIVGTITGIEPYYTQVKTKYGILAGTPTTIAPMEDK